MRTPGAPNVPIDPAKAVEPGGRPDAVAIRRARNTTLGELGRLSRWLTGEYQGPLDHVRIWGFVLTQLPADRQLWVRAIYQDTVDALQTRTRELKAKGADPHQIEECEASLALLLPAQRLFADLAR